MRSRSWEQAYIESFQDKLRDECLNREIFYSLLEARLILEQWRVNTTNPGHTALWAISLPKNLRHLKIQSEELFPRI